MAKKRNRTRVTPSRIREARSSRFVEEEFNPDYAPVIKDLKRIGILAGSFFVVLVTLSFFLN